MPDPNDPKAPTRRQTDDTSSDWSDHRRNGLKFRLFGQSITLPERLVFTAIVTVMLFWVLGAFSKWGWESPVIPRNSGQQEHRDILEELLVTNYVLAECLRVEGECPRLPKPRRLRVNEGRP